MNEPSACADHRLALFLVVLVGDVADDELDQILDRNETVGAAIFVDDERKVDAGGLHLGQQIERRHRRRRVERLADDLRRHERHRQIDIDEVEIALFRRLLPTVLAIARRAARRRMRRHEGDKIADVDHAARIVERVVVDDEARMRGALENLDQFTERNVLLHGDDVGARHHHAFDPRLAQAQDILEHGRFFGEKPDCGSSAVSTSSRSARVDAAFQPNRMRMTRVSQPSDGSAASGSRSARARFSLSLDSVRMGDCAVMGDFRSREEFQDSLARRILRVWVFLAAGCRVHTDPGS